MPFWHAFFQIFILPVRAFHRFWLKPKPRRNWEKLSIIMGMMDKISHEIGKNIHHNGCDGQNQPRNRKNYPS
ncbi:hypothetical protein CVD19_19970 [Bacillus sp. T33-2]|nr:hypothetical protein CVD19_19970 [Bacillus sp. T33-2]